MPTREEILAELDRRKSASAPGGLSPEAIRAELARRAAMQAAAPSINRPSMGFDPVGEAARGMQKPMMDAMGSAVLGRPLPTQPAPPVDPLAPKGGWSPGQQQQQQARVADPGNPFNPKNAGRPDTGAPPPPDFGALAEKAAKSIGGMIGGQRPESEAMAQFGGSVVTDPVNAANTAIEVLDPFHQAAYAYNDADAALKAAVTGDWKRAGNELKDLFQSGSFAAMSFLPGAEFAGAPGRMARAAGVAPKAAGAMASAAPEAVAAQVAPKPPQPMFTGPPGPAPSKGNFIVRRADQIVGGAVGATVGGTGDAIAAPGDGGGEEGGPPMGAISGAAIGIFGPRALANASSRGFRAAARPFRGGASFDERVAAKAVREALRSAGIRSADEAAAQMAARYGDKPAAVADLTQEGIGTAAGLSRLPGKTGEAAKARNADLLENRSGRLFTDIEGTTGIDPASVTKSIDDAIRQASEEISPAYEEMFAASRGVNSERLMQLMDDPVVAPYLRRAVQASESLATTAGQAPSNARTWDLVKRGLDRVIEGQIRTSGQAAPELMSARQAVRDELDGLIPEYKSIRDNADAPRMRAARKEGANAMGGRLSVEKVKKIASGLTGRPLTAMQAGMIEQLVPGIEKGQGITALASGRTEQALAAAFGEETARSLISRVRADAALTQNASRINPNVGSVTSQAGMGGGGVGGMIAGAVRAVRNPTEAGLSWLSKSGAYSKQQRDIMGEMLLEGTTPENLQRIFRGRGGPTAPRPQGPPRSAPRPPVKMGFGSGSKQPLPMDEASRMGRAREQGFDVERVAYRGLGRAYDESGKGGGRRYQMFTSSDSDAAEYGSNVVAAYLRKGNNLQLDGGGRNFNSVPVSQLPDDVRAKLHPSIQGVARIDDIADAAQKAGYDSVTVANVFDNAWGEVPTKPRARTQKDIDLDNELLRELGVEPADAASTPRVPAAADKNTNPVTIDVVFDTKNIRSTKAAFDPSQSGSSKLLAGMPAGTSEAALGVGGGAYGAANPVDWDGDGTITDEEKHKTIMSYGMGSMFTPFLAKGGAGIARDVAKSVTIPKAANAAGRRFTEVGARKAWDRDLPGSSEFRSPAQSTFGGVKAKTADLKLQRIAQDMEKAGASRDQIWKETGWFKGVDGKWRFEIDDSKARYRGPITSSGEIPGGMSGAKTTGTLPHFLTDADAGGAYPSLKRARVSVNRGIGEGSFGSGSMNPALRSAPDSITTYAKDGPQTRSVLLHERQHAVQGKEDFAQGGQPATFDQSKYETDVWREAHSLANSDGKSLLTLGDDAQQKYLGAAQHRMYKRLAGETEARNVQTRRDFTPEQRRARPPWETQDVPDDQQIVRYGSSEQRSEGPWGPRGSRPNAMGDYAAHQAAQKQLKELEAYRKTAPASEHAAVDQEISDLRQFLEGKK